MSAIRVAAAGSAMASPREVTPTARKALQQRRTIQPAAIVAVRAHLMAGWEGVKGGHAVQETANLDAVPIPAMQRVREVYQRGFDSMKGGHGVQQATFEPQVSSEALNARRDDIADNMMGFAGGNPIQRATTPLQPFDPAPSARALAADVAGAITRNPSDLPRMQAAQLHARAARQILG
jgi:hypothetical protein